MTCLRRALEVRPHAASIRAALAQLLHASGCTDEALAAARLALTHDPDCHSASLVVAHCHLARGNRVLARLAVARIARDRPGWQPLGPFFDPSPETPGPAPPSVESLPAPSRSRLPAGLSVFDHAAALRAVLLRGLALKHAGNPLWLPLELLRPTAVIAAPWVLFAVLHKPMPGQIPIPLFVLAGFSVWFAFNYAALGAANGAKFPAGVTAWPGVSPLHLRLARALWPLLINLCFCLLAVLPLELFRSDLSVPDIPLTCLVFAVAGIGGVGYGILFERLAALVPGIAVVEKLLGWMLFVTSGLYFVVYSSGPIAGSLLLFNPLLHLIEVQRNAFDPGYPLLLVDLRYPAIVAAGLFTLGAAALSIRSER